MILSHWIDTLLSQVGEEVTIENFFNLLETHSKEIYAQPFENERGEWYLLEWCCFPEVIYGFVDRELTDEQINFFYSQLFDVTPPTLFHHGGNRCHWIAKCFHLKGYHFTFHTLLDEEKVHCDNKGNTPLHYAYLYLNYHLIHVFAHPMVWCRNQKGQTIESLNVLRGQGVPLVTQVIHQHYQTQLQRVKQRYHLHSSQIYRIQRYLGM